MFRFEASTSQEHELRLVAGPDVVQSAPENLYKQGGVASLGVPTLQPYALAVGFLSLVLAAYRHWSTSVLRTVAAIQE